MVWDGVGKRGNLRWRDGWIAARESATAYAAYFLTYIRTYEKIWNYLMVWYIIWDQNRHLAPCLQIMHRIINYPRVPVLNIWAFSWFFCDTLPDSWYENFSPVVLADASLRTESCALQRHSHRNPPPCLYLRLPSLKWNQHSHGQTSFKLWFLKPRT